MRNSCRLSLASILLIAVAGLVSAQDNSAAPAPTAPEPVVTAVPELPAIPSGQAVAPAVQPAPPAVPDTVPVIEPVPAVNPPEPAKAPDSVVTTKRAQTRKIVKKNAEKPATKEALPPEAAGAGLSTAAVGTTGNTPPPPPPAAAAVVAPAASSAPPPASTVDTSAIEKSEETTSKRQMGLGGWILVALSVAALVAAISWFRRRRPRTKTSIVDHGTLGQRLQPSLLLSKELNPTVAPRP